MRAEEAVAQLHVRTVMCVRGQRLLEVKAKQQKQPSPTSVSLPEAKSIEDAGSAVVALAPHFKRVERKKSSKWKHSVCLETSCL